MSYFPNLPADAGVRHILALNPQAGRALIEFHTAVLRVDTALTAVHKELIAAYARRRSTCGAGPSPGKREVAAEESNAIDC